MGGDQSSVGKNSSGALCPVCHVIPIVCSPSLFSILPFTTGLLFSSSSSSFNVTDNECDIKSFCEIIHLRLISIPPSN